jgi:hypothetical protein
MFSLGRSRTNYTKGHRIRTNRLSVAGAIIAWAIMPIMILTSIYIFKGNYFAPEIGVVLMPLGFAGLFPEQFKELSISYS